MIEAATSSIAVASLLLVSFCSFIAGVVFRKWPEKVQEYAESVDGFVWLITPEAHRAIIALCSLVLHVMSFAALLAAGFIL